MLERILKTRATPLRARRAAANLDIAVSAGGKFLFSLNAARGAVGMFAIQSNGTVTNLGTTVGLPAAGGLNGIAAN